MAIGKSNPGTSPRPAEVRIPRPREATSGRAGELSTGPSVPDRVDSGPLGMTSKKQPLTDPDEPGHEPAQLQTHTAALPADEIGDLELVSAADRDRAVAMLRSLGGDGNQELVLDAFAAEVERAQRGLLADTRTAPRSRRTDGDSPIRPNHLLEAGTAFWLRSTLALVAKEGQRAAEVGVKLLRGIEESDAAKSALSFVKNRAGVATTWSMNARPENLHALEQIGRMKEARQAMGWFEVAARQQPEVVRLAPFIKQALLDGHAFDTVKGALSGSKSSSAIHVDRAITELGRRGLVRPELIEKLGAEGERALAGVAIRGSKLLRGAGQALAVAAAAMAIHRFLQALRAEPSNHERIAKEGIHTISQTAWFCGAPVVALAGTLVDLAWEHTLRQRDDQDRSAEEVTSQAASPRQPPPALPRRG